MPNILKTGKNILRRQAHHGGPHDFDKFDLAKIGTGEGSQMEGWGLYFADKKSVAKWYRDALSGKGHYRFRGKQLSNTGELLAAKPKGVDPKIWDDVVVFLTESDDLADAKKGLQEAIQWWDDPKNFEHTRGAVNAKKQVEFFKSVQPFLDEFAEDAAPKGHLYTAEIPSEFHMLDLELPLAKQQEDVWNALTEGLPKEWLFKKDSNTTISGRRLYQRMSAHLGGDKEASLKLKELGILGNTYIGDSSGQRNFVVFDDEMINILEKGNIDPKLLALMGGTIAAGHQNADKLRNLPKGAPEAAATILSGLGGGVADMAIRAGGILNPFNTMEESKAAGARAANALQYQPSEAAAPFLAPIADFMQKAQDTAEYDWQQIPGHKKIEEIWGQLNPRLREAITLGADIAL